MQGEGEEPDNLELETILDQMDVQENYSGLRAQDLQVQYSVGAGSACTVV